MTGRDAELFGEVYAAHAAACRVYARHLSSDAGGAEDATHEAFVKLARRLAEGRPLPEHLRAWLLSAVRSAALDARRSFRRRERREAFVAYPPAFELSTGALDAAEVTAALERLPERQREVVVLHLWAGLTFAEAGALVGVSASTAHGDYTVGLATLRTRLDPTHLTTPPTPPTPPTPNQRGDNG